MKQLFDLKYIIGFPIQDDQVLMLRRNKHPWVGKWNGAGGKIELGETPEQTLLRELFEETSLDLRKAKENRFVGIVTWEWDNREPTPYMPGMYAFISFLDSKQKIWHEERIIREGVIAWKPISQVCDQSNPDIAVNLTHFLPVILEARHPKRYHCIFKNDVMQELKVLSLPKTTQFQIPL